MVGMGIKQAIFRFYSWLAGRFFYPGFTRSNKSIWNGLRLTLLWNSREIKCCSPCHPHTPSSHPLTSREGVPSTKAFRWSCHIERGRNDREDSCVMRPFCWYLVCFSCTLMQTQQHPSIPTLVDQIGLNYFQTFFQGWLKGSGTLTV